MRRKWRARERERESDAFLGAFAELRKANISFFMSVRPSVCPK